MAQPKCKIHNVPLVCPVCRAIAAGSVRSEAKTEASRANGKLGGRPRKNANQPKVS